MARCIVMGGNGFIGAALVDQLVLAGHDVTAFDRFTRTPPIFSAPARVLQGDFLDADAVARAIAGQEFVFHFLSATTPATADDDPRRDVLENLVPTIALLESCAAAGVGRVFFASTGGAIYGDHDVDVVAENVAPQPVSPYAIGKLAIEGYLAYFSRKHGLASTSFRISNPYGPNQRANRSQGVIPTFLAAAREGRALRMYGDGSSVRDYIYIDDAVRMIATTVGREPKHAIYNIGSGHGTRLTELLETIARVTGIEPRVEHVPTPPTFVHGSVLDPSRFRGEFGTAELLSLDDGIARTWAAGEARS